MKAQNTASWLISITLIVVALIYGQSLLVPFIFALLIWFVVKKVRNLVDKIHFIRHYIPSWIKSIIASLVVFAALLGMADLLVVNIQKLAASYPTYLSNVESIALTLNNLLNINVQAEMTHFLTEYDFTSYLQSFMQSLSYILGNAVMIIFYTIFLFVEESLFRHKIKLILSDRAKYMRYKEVADRVDKSMSSYISLKSLINLITAALGYVIFLILGMEAPIFWAFLIFMFNFIPSVGPILGTLLPAFFALIQFGEFLPFTVILLGVGTISMLVGSFLEPKLMGNTLNISPLVAIIALAFWGSIWGIVGMLLSVPITVAMIIIFSQFPATRATAILLSEKGRV
jgi:predicted PurR-regulated permease PerM